MIYRFPTSCASHVKPTLKKRYNDISAADIVSSQLSLVLPDAMAYL